MPQVTAHISTAKYRTSLTTASHQIISDEPIPLGADLGPTPYELLLMALGSCVSMTLKMYAGRKGWDLQEVEVHLDQDRKHASDCEDCASETGFVHEITKKIKFTGNLTDEQKQRLMQIADKCPVNKTLLNEIVIRTEAL